ncbi:hypothetical protein RHGRI_006233 [Rhododendron griersonianum]|uniref:Uncharacterized protein n=1 Tax=Rhododendron griersonianum TaxID=479676 RepID=A0AAV6KSX6_9ERIC|nr:hypothetical protein RHGRI_006233 [Rhododendron griersonianum]
MDSPNDVVQQQFSVQSLVSSGITQSPIARSSSHWTRSVAVNTIAGTMLFSVAASMLAEEVHAKESSSKNFVFIGGTPGPLQFEHTTSVTPLQSDRPLVC